MDGNNTNKIRVAVYCRIGNAQKGCTSSCRLQKTYYENFVISHAGWECCGFYMDYGLWTKTGPRPEFDRLLNDCRAGKIDIIVTKNVSRLHRDLIDVIATLRELRDLSPPVGVYFEDTGLNTLDANVTGFLQDIEIYQHKKTF